MVTAVPAEADAVLRLLGAHVSGAGDARRVERPSGPVDVLAAGVGIAHAAAGAAASLAGGNYDAVLSAGIAGGFAGVPLAAVVVASAVVHADLGAEDGPQFVAVSQLGFGTERTELDAGLTAELTRRCSSVSAPAVVGSVLSVSTVTGTAATSARRQRSHPDAVAEAMEGAGVLAAGQRFGVAVGEVRAISNAVGPRDRSRWQVVPALDALAAAFERITAAEWVA